MKQFLVAFVIIGAALAVSPPELGGDYSVRSVLQPLSDRPVPVGRSFGQVYYAPYYQQPPQAAYGAASYSHPAATFNQPQDFFRSAPVHAPIPQLQSYTADETAQSPFSAPGQAFPPNAGPFNPTFVPQPPQDGRLQTRVLPLNLRSVV